MAAAPTTPATSGDACHESNFEGILGVPGRTHFAPAPARPTSIASAPGEIPNIGAITACLRWQKAGLSEACRAVFEP
jgi:hypothetical protein